MQYLSRAQVREIDRRATAEYGIPGIVLMENAGRGCAELLIELNPKRYPIAIYCGPGNNGGDGFVIARHLYNYSRRLWDVKVYIPGDPEQFTGDALANYQVIRDSKKIPINNVMGYLETPMWIVDALFGTGLSRPLEPPYSEWVAEQAYGVSVLSIDIPSGLDCDTGEPLGVRVKATHTATFVAPKLGFKNPNSKQYTGKVHVLDIGIPQQLLAEYS